MIPRNIFCWLAAICCLGAAICDTCRAQSPPPENQQYPLQAEKTERVRADNLNDEKESSGVRLPEAAPENELGLALLKNLLNDQKAIWTSPAHLRLGDATWLVPFAGRTAGFLVTDQDASSHLSHTPSTLSHYTNFSNYGLAGMAGAGAGRYIYWDNYYHDLYTNRNFLMGDWVGRDEAGIQAWSHFWLSPKNSIQFGYRHLKVDNKFIPNGGTVNGIRSRRLLAQREVGRFSPCSIRAMAISATRRGSPEKRNRFAPNHLLARNPQAP